MNLQLRLVFLTLIFAILINSCYGTSSVSSNNNTSVSSTSKPIVPPKTVESSSTTATNILKEPEILSYPAYFVSLSGNDSNYGTKPSSPFATFERARLAMRGSSTKITYIMAGTYPIKSTLKLDNTDDGESWLAYPDQIPILDGNKKINVAIEVGGNNITLRWLTIQNFTECGIKGNNINELFIDSNIIKNISSTAWGQAAIELGGSVKNGKITHNLIERVGYSGIEINATTGDDISNLLIEMNAVHDTCLTDPDCGGIYVMDRSHVNTGVKITSNVIGNYGNDKNQGVGIYLDDEISNVTVKNNIIYGTGSFAFQIHGGDHNTFINNIFDISKIESLGMYDDISTSTEKTLTNFGMKGNTFKCNIIYSSSSIASPLWTYNNEGLASRGMNIDKPEVSSNIYWEMNSTLPNTGIIIDSNPIFTNPQFVDPSNADYHFKSGLPTSCSFLPIELNKVGPLQH